MKNDRRRNPDSKTEWRMAKVSELSGDGYSERDIAAELQLSKTTIHNDIVFMREWAKERIETYTSKIIPFEYESTLASIRAMIKNLSEIIKEAKQRNDNKEVMQATTIKLQAQNIKMEMVSGAKLVHENIDLEQKYRGFMAQRDKVLKDGHEQST